jgi:hypothetical protein
LGEGAETVCKILFPQPTAATCILSRKPLFSVLNTVVVRLVQDLQVAVEFSLRNKFAKAELTLFGQSLSHPSM